MSVSRSLREELDDWGKGAFAERRLVTGGSTFALFVCAGTWVARQVEKAAAEPSKMRQAWDNRLQQTWRGNDKKEEVARRAALLKKGPIFATRSTKELRMLALALEHMEYAEGERIFSEGDEPDGVYVLEQGSCAVHVKGLGAVARVQEVGTVFGEICMFLEGSPRTATIVAEQKTRCYRMKAAEAMEILEESWGDQEELHRRAGLLGACDLFSEMREAELIVLATAMNLKVFHRPGVHIVKEGERGQSMYVIEGGNPIVSVQGTGRVAELAPGDIFGELAVLQAPKSWRTATVTTSDMETVVFSLKQEDVFRLIPDARREKLLEKAQETYDAHAK
eukprot:COSAG04_NODE_6103_length_1410_cov_1.174676_2_plen_335_part_01